jgi:hypothetical protein
MKLETYNLLQYPCSCTFALVHEESKTVVLYDTVNFFKTLGEILNKLSTSVFDYPEFHDYKHQLTVSVISTEQNLDTRRQMFSTEIEKFKQEGYTVLNRKQTLLKYKIRKIITRFNKQTVVCVVKVNSRNEKLVMGVFSNMVEADSFIESLGSLEIIPDIQASNNLTQEYINRQYNIPLRL